MFENLPTLQGSEKQISWATQIREIFVKQFSKRILNPRMPEQDRSLEIQMVNSILKVNKASVFIDFKSTLNQHIFADTIESLYNKFIEQKHIEI